MNKKVVARRLIHLAKVLLSETNEEEDGDTKAQCEDAKAKDEEEKKDEKSAMEVEATETSSNTETFHADINSTETANIIPKAETNNDDDVSIAKALLDIAKELGQE